MFDSSQFSHMKALQVVLYLRSQLGSEIVSLNDVLVKWATPNFTNFLPWLVAESLQLLSESDGH